MRYQLRYVRVGAGSCGRAAERRLYPIASEPTPNRPTRRRPAPRSSHHTSSTAARSSAREPSLSIDRVGDGAALLVAGLGRHPGPRVVLGHAPPGQPRQPGRRRRPPRRRTKSKPAGQVVLDQQRHVVDDTAPSGTAARARPTAARPAGARSRSDRPRFASSANTSTGEGGPVEATVGGHDAGAEACHDRGQPGGARLDDLAGDRVGVDDHRAVLGEQRGDGALARSDAAGQPTLARRAT